MSTNIINRAVNRAMEKTDCRFEAFILNIYLSNQPLNTLPVKVFVRPLAECDESYVLVDCNGMTEKEVYFNTDHIVKVEIEYR